MTYGTSINDDLGAGGLENVVVAQTDASGATVLVGADGNVIHPTLAYSRSILLVGDSIMADSTYRQAGTYGDVLMQRSFGFFGFANKLLKQRFTRIINNAVGGSQAVQWVAGSAADRNLTTQIADVNAAYCLIEIGTNDIGAAGRTAAQVLADIYTIWQAAHNSGKHTTVCTIAPRRTGGGSNFTAAQQKTLALVNAGLMKYAATVDGFHLIDIAPSITDYTVGAYESPATTNRVLYDDIHFNNRAAYLVGKKIKTHYDALVPVFDAGASAYLDDSTSDATNKNLLNCGLMQGTLGLGRPTGWNVPSAAGGLTATITETVVTAPDSVGNGYQFDINATAATGTGGFVRTYAIWDNTTAPLVAGDTVFAEVYFKIEGINGSGTPVNINTPRLQLQLAAGASPAYSSDGEEGTSTGTMAALPSENFEGVLRTAPYVYQGTEAASLNTTLWLNMYFFGVGSCRVTFWRARVMKNDDYYTPFGTIDHTFPWQ